MSSSKKPFDTSELGGSKDKRVASVERRAASLVGTTRNAHRARLEERPDMPAVRASNGDAVQCDAKSKRVGMPKWVTEGLQACRRYTPGAVPVLLVYPIKGEALAILPADALAHLAGFQPPKKGEQLTLAAPQKKGPP